MSLVGFEPTISAGEWPQTYALHCVATGIGTCKLYLNLKKKVVVNCFIWSISICGSEIWIVRKVDLILKVLNVVMEKDGPVPEAARSKA
jgi:hypothetical protein